MDTAQSAWAQLKSDLAQSGVTNLNDGTAATAALLAETKASVEQQILSATFGTSSGDGTSVTSLLGGSSASSNGAGLSSSLIGDWLTYQAGGNTSPLATANSTGNGLDTTA